MYKKQVLEKLLYYIGQLEGCIRSLVKFRHLYCIYSLDVDFSFLMTSFLSWPIQNFLENISGGSK